MVRVRRLRWLLAAAIVLAAAPSPAEDPLGPPSGTLRLESKGIALGIGVSWGDGTLYFHDKQYPFSVSGLSVAAVGISRLTAVGEVWGLRDPSQLEGTYYGVDVGVAVGGGGAGIAMRNEKGVYIKLRAAQQGVKLSVASQGTTIKLVR